ncbi:MAG: Phosphoribosylformimino-5-aminoimidazole carboxamide ribotide isomerase [uncultured bacterium]|nr:MAG: Phosphoribosylformimino-5-aminoimidazole carboxamide ribotide isomerase [uncultured bacterium]
MIAIIDYKAGNIASLVAALKRLGQDCVVTSDPKVIQVADKVIFPGQGRAAPALRELQRTGIDKIIPLLKQPFLGVCLGMQLLMESSEEDNAQCLGVIPGQVVKFRTAAPVPQVGWNNGYYFVHSYFVETALQYTVSRAQYGGQWFASIIAKDNFFGVQFHPEKSGAAGLKLMQQFCEAGKIQPTQIIPAIDLLNGKCVRLRQGEYNQATQYSDDPVAVAQQFAQQGATWLHVVDLDGAKVGAPVNQKIIKELVDKSGLRVEVGGGIRISETAKQYLDAGVDRVILGTAAIQRPELVGELISTYGRERVVVGLDVKSGAVATQGWTVNTGISLLEALGQFKKYNLQYVIVTDVSKDGMLAGPNLELAKKVQQAGFDVIVSGGVTTQQDIKAVQAMNAAGMIIGKALYEGKLTIKQPGFTKRIIACLDIAQGRVVKGTHFTDLQDKGDAVALAKKYEEQGADEIVFLDIMATVENRDTLYGLVTQVAETLSIPFCVGGGVRTVEDIRELLLAGADKVSIGSAAIKDPSLVQQASAQFGAQCIVISIDPKWNGQFYEMYIKGGREATGVDAVVFAKQMEQAGAGELLVNSLDRDGTKQGYDLKLLAAISSAVQIPVIASSGAGTVQHVVEAFAKTNCSAALVAGMLHNGQLTILDIKKNLVNNLIPVRL